MVAIFIDESGSFTTARPFSVVSALSLPHTSLDALRLILAHISRDWPRLDGELKGGQLTSQHLAKLVDALFRKEAVLHSTVAYVGKEHGTQIESHKAEQCEGLTKHLTQQHSKKLTAQLWALRQQLEAMSPQLYVQCVAQSELIGGIVEDIPNYFAQRRPMDLAKFEWFVDAKDKEITPQEKWWKATLGPLLQSRSRRHPAGRLDILPTVDYSYFDREYDITKNLWHPQQPSRVVTGTNIRKVVTDNLYFKDSKADILIQAVDILGRFVRRAIEGQVVDAATIDVLGRLQIRKRLKGRYQSIQFISLAQEPMPDDRHLVSIMKRMTLAGRPLLTPQSEEAIDRLPKEI